MAQPNPAVVRKIYSKVAGKLFQEDHYTLLVKAAVELAWADPHYRRGEHTPMGVGRSIYRDAFDVRCVCGHLVQVDRLAAEVRLREDSHPEERRILNPLTARRKARP